MLWSNCVPCVCVHSFCVYCACAVSLFHDFQMQSIPGPILCTRPPLTAFPVACYSPSSLLKKKKIATVCIAVQ